MVDEKEILAQNLKNYRKEQKLSQFEFAEDCGISKETLSLIERSEENVTLDTLQLLSAKTGKTPGELLSQLDAKYILIPSTLATLELKQSTYGIGTIKDDILIDYVPGISNDYNRVLSTVKLCNDDVIAPCHLRAIIENEFGCN